MNALIFIIPIVTGVAGFAAALLVFLAKNGSTSAQDADPEAAAEQLIRLLMTRWVTFLMLMVTTLVCLTVQLGIIENRKTAEPEKPDASAEETSPPKASTGSQGPPVAAPLVQPDRQESRIPQK